jgi:hypothetical protein
MGESLLDVDTRSEENDDFNRGNPVFFLKSAFESLPK